MAKSNSKYCQKNSAITNITKMIPLIKSAHQRANRCGVIFFSLIKYIAIYQQS